MESNTEPLENKTEQTIEEKNDSNSNHIIESNVYDDEQQYEHFKTGEYDVEIEQFEEEDEEVDEEIEHIYQQPDEDILDVTLNELKNKLEQDKVEQNNTTTILEIILEEGQLRKSPSPTKIVSQIIRHRLGGRRRRHKRNVGDDDFNYEDEYGEDTEDGYDSSYSSHSSSNLNQNNLPESPVNTNHETNQQMADDKIINEPELAEADNELKDEIDSVHNPKPVQEEIINKQKQSELQNSSPGSKPKSSSESPVTANGPESDSVHKQESPEPEESRNRLGRTCMCSCIKLCIWIVVVAILFQLIVSRICQQEELYEPTDQQIENETWFTSQLYRPIKQIWCKKP